MLFLGMSSMILDAKTSSPVYCHTPVTWKSLKKHEKSWKIIKMKLNRTFWYLNGYAPQERFGWDFREFRVGIRFFALQASYKIYKHPLKRTKQYQNITFTTEMSPVNSSMFWGFDSVVRVHLIQYIAFMWNSIELSLVPYFGYDIV